MEIGLFLEEQMDRKIYVNEKQWNFGLDFNKL